MWKTSRRTAVKVFQTAKTYAVELECYRRLQAAGITKICGYAIPRLASYDDNLLVIEMSLVNPPYVLDFGKVTLDRQPDYPPATIAYVREEQQEWWGDLYPTIRKILRRLEALGIFYADPKPGNIMPENWDPEL